MNNSNDTNTNNLFLTSQYIPRPRINKILDKATRCNLVYVIAGAGYGKTQAVRHYIEQQPDAVVRWRQLTESDNIGSNFWEHLVHNIYFDNPELVLKFREFGFPETLARFKQFASLLKNTEYLPQEYIPPKTFVVLDDFHLIHSKPILTFIERYIHLHIPNLCMVIISRQEPEINAISLFSKGQVSIITENDLRFTEDEIAAFLKFREIPFLTKNLSVLFDATKGWAIALQLLSLALKRIPGNFDFALHTMKHNIFKLIETEAFDGFPENVQKIMVQLALVSDLPLAPLHVFFSTVSFTHIPQLMSFIWFDSLIGDYRIHPLYLEFLQSKLHILSNEEKQNTYRQAAQWCFKNNFYMDAMRYFAKSHQFGRMLETLLSYPFKLPSDTCEYFFNILEELDPNNEERTDTSLLLLKNFFIPILLMGMGRYEEAKIRTFDIIREWEKVDTPFALNILYSSYSNLAYIQMYICTVTHEYTAPEYLKKSSEYYKLSSVPPVKITGPFAVADMRSYACTVGEGAKFKEFDIFLEATRQSIFYMEETFHDMYYGYDDLVACEIAFFKNQPETARHYAHSAILKAREKKQYSIEAMAEQYLLRLAMREGNYPLVKEISNQLRSHLDNPDFWNRQLLYDLYVGSVYAQFGIQEMALDWFVMDEKEAAAEVRLPIRELIVNVRYCIFSKKYEQALTILCNSTPRDPYERFFFGELMLSLLFAVAKLNTGDEAGALVDFQKAYHLSFGGELEMFYIELGKELRPLVAAALKRADCGIPYEWLKKIDRKVSAYAKKIAVVLHLFKKENHIEDTIQLSAREREVLNDLYHGLTREEIAENRYLAVPTVKKIVQSIYTKLDANNNVDAIRIAIQKKLIE